MTWGVALAFIAAGVIAFAVSVPKAQPIPRHHTYWCMVTVCLESGPHQYCQSQTDVCGAFRAIEKDV